MTSDILLPGWVTATQAAKMLGVDGAYIHRLVALGNLPEGRRIDGAERVTFFRESDIKYYLKTHPDVGKRRAANQQTA